MHLLPNNYARMLELPESRPNQAQIRGTIELLITSEKNLTET